jgi:radical SAM protein with 4Fe4S-binding SPASM domain
MASMLTNLEQEGNKMSKTFQSENDELMLSFLNRTFLKAYKDPTSTSGLWNSIEYIISPDCNLSCNYCYVARHKDGLYPPNIRKAKDIKKHGLMINDWIVENEYKPHFELFSGEATLHQSTFDIAYDIMDRVTYADTVISIPTNFTWLLNDKMTKKVEDLMDKSINSRAKVSLSASFDGWYCEPNRPFAGNHLDGGKQDSLGIWNWNKGKTYKDPRLYSEDYYSKVFEFTNKYGNGFHPMIYSENIDKWKDNWLWFQEQFKKYNISFANIYLLEVRNPEWSAEQCKQFEEFCRFLVHWTFDYFNKDISAFMDFVIRGKAFNLLTSIIAKTGRGIGCSIQSTLMCRLGDLAIVPCHRTSYDHLNFGKFNVQNDKIVGFKSQNIEHMIHEYSFDAKAQPYCEQCPINDICPHGCLGAQYEVFGDPYIPIPTVCRMEHAKLRGLIKGYMETETLMPIYYRLPDDYKRGWDFMMEIIQNENKIIQNENKS